MKKIKIGLLARIVIAIILGIAIGTVFPAPLVRIFVTFNGIFSEFLNFSIPLIIVGLVTVAIADIGKGAGKMLLLTALIAYFFKWCTRFDERRKYCDSCEVGEKA